MVLVTGATGFIGSHLVEALCSQGEPVRCLVRRASSRLPAQAELVQGDLLSGAGLDQALEGVDTVMHLAGVTKALRVADYYSGNATATENLAHAVSQGRRGVRLVHVSSLAAIGPSLDGIPVREDAEPHPLTHYGESKLKAERIVQRLTPDAVIVRPPAVYGPRDTDIFQLLRSISKGLVLRLAGGERYFSAIYVKDLVDGLLCAARAPCAKGRTYFLAHEKIVSWSDLGAAAAGVMGRDPLVVRVPRPVAYAVGYCAERWSRLTSKPGIVSREKVKEAQCRHWTCDTRRAAQELGFEARTPLETGMAATLAWYKEAGWLKY
jgi:nucleoside-diphosphate-sugar epimerase